METSSTLRASSIEQPWANSISRLAKKCFERGDLSNGDESRNRN
jgi:hypothetical protein